MGNPPFLGGQRITGANGTDYRNHLIARIADSTKGSADLVAYFFLNATKIAKSFGLLAANTIAQGDTSEVGLTQIIALSAALSQNPPSRGLDRMDRPIPQRPESSLETPPRMTSADTPLRPIRELLLACGRFNCMRCR